MSETVLQARGLSKTFGRGEGLVRAVDEVDLEVCAGETVAVMGPSGCGKSTLLHLLGGLERASGGEIVLAGSRLDQMGERALARLRRTAIGFVFQAFHLIDELTAQENVGRGHHHCSGLARHPPSPGRGPSIRGRLNRAVQDLSSERSVVPAHELGCSAWVGGKSRCRDGGSLASVRPWVPPGMLRSRTSATCCRTDGPSLMM